MSKNPRERVEQFKTFFNLKKDIDLSTRLNVATGTIAQWKNKGLADSSEKLLDAIFDEIGHCELARRSGASFCPVCGKPVKRFTDPTK